ncbi:Membrane protein involved in the export of O-antigen and teichoic acid [Haloarcula vallismortis]|uniref:Membrane protein involved in the export of O-antigen and teichoic acid n=2 Tax=Haloarcula vallismortis TaxID=28442 RepID=A0A1H2UWL5_HALVA|nr:flippase [Haloarcula vallismortis]SDW60455.1 Membrane protein involved in the export of O-antigen and teichoic acid [Haloarcula vallismortis]
MAHSRVKDILRSGGINFVGMAVRLTLSFLVSVLAARYLGQIGYGTLSIGTTILAAVSTLTMVGLGQGVSGYLPRYDSPETKRDILVSASLIILPVSVGIATALIVAAPFLSSNIFDDPSLVPVIRVCALGIPVANIGQLAVSAIRGNKQTLPKVLIDDICLQGSRVILVALFGLIGLGTVAIASAYTASLVLSATFGLYYLIRQTPLISASGTIKVRRDLLSYSFPLWISAGMSVIYSGTDTFIIAYFSETASVGIYNVVYPLAHHLSIIMISVGYIALPTFSEMHANNEYGKIKSNYQSVTEWVLAGTLVPFLMILFFPNEIITLFFGSEFTVGSLALSILAFGFFFHSITGPTSDIVKAIDASRLVMVDGAVAALVNFILNIILVPQFDYIGAAIATTSSYALLNGLYSYQVYTRTGAHPFSKKYLLLITLTAIPVSGWFLLIL